jgi:hypothetical protein
VGVAQIEAEDHPGPAPIHCGLGFAIGDPPLPSANVGQELFTKLSPDTYNNATALARARVGALSILLRSGSRPSVDDVQSGEESNMALTSTTPEILLNPNNAEPAAALSPLDPFSPSTSLNSELPPLLRSELSQSLRRNLRRHRKLSRTDTLGPQPRPYLTFRRASRPANPLPRNLVSLNPRVQGS